LFSILLTSRIQGYYYQSDHFIECSKLYDVSSEIFSDVSKLSVVLGSAFSTLQLQSKIEVKAVHGYLLLLYAVGFKADLFHFPRPKKENNLKADHFRYLC
jgi:hypothetical protein